MPTTITEQGFYVCWYDTNIGHNRWLYAESPERLNEILYTLRNDPAADGVMYFREQDERYGGMDHTTYFVLYTDNRGANRWRIVFAHSRLKGCIKRLKETYRLRNEDFHVFAGLYSY